MKRSGFRLPAVVWKWGGATLVIAGFVLAAMTHERWYPTLTGWVRSSVAAFRPSEAELPEAVGGGGDDTSLELSEQAMRNIGLSDESIRPITLQTFRRSMTVPAVIAERPGRTHLEVATPMTGVITHVHAIEGEAVEPGTLLFQIRLTHEDLVQAQTDFLRTLGELDVEEREIRRLSSVTRSGAVAGKVLLEREYARDRLIALQRAQREALRLHGLSDAQVSSIIEDRRLVRELKVFAPSADSGGRLELSGNPIHPVAFRGTGPGTQSSATPLVLQKLNVHKGQSVNAGQTLAKLADYGELFIEGMAFERDIPHLRQSSQRGWRVTAAFEPREAATELTEQLEIAFLSNEVDVTSRTLHFYVGLRNTIATDRRSDGEGYIEWKYLPGQRLQLRVPVEEWSDQIVLPVDAVAREGAEYFAFRQNGKHFDRVPIHVRYRDQYSVVVANDGSLFPGDRVAMRGAHQMQMALRNKAGGAPDPHHGHSH